ncbi:MAG: hypothetical protein JO165_02235 [Candidatus Eremiobacteraeota bacterium]|nr:hypothetical protein [Candidatus Eremiobacteraeota bacterium]
MRRGQLGDLSLYFRALPVYARNLGVALPPLVAALIMLLLTYISGPLFSGVGGLGASLLSPTGIIGTLLTGFALGTAIIFADDAWRHGRARIQLAWDDARRKAGNILLTALGFYFIIYVAQLVGSLLPIPFLPQACQAVALFFLIYSLPSASIGGTPAQLAFSTSIRAARSYPIQTLILTIIFYVFVFWLADYLTQLVLPYVSYYGALACRVLFVGILQGYVALVLAKQYSDFTFRGPYW